MKKVALSSSFFPCLALVEAGLVALDDLGVAVVTLQSSRWTHLNVHNADPETTGGETFRQNKKRGFGPWQPPKSASPPFPNRDDEQAPSRMCAKD